MMIGRTRLSVGPLRDLDQLDATIMRIGGIPGVERVTVNAFVDRQALLAAHVLHPLDLAGELRAALRDELRTCTIGADCVEVVLHDGVLPRGETVDGTLEEVDGTLEEVDGTLEEVDGTLEEDDGTLEEDDGTLEEDDAPPVDEGELLALTFAQAPAGLALLGLDGRWLRVNRRICRLLGRDEASVVRSGAGALAGTDAADAARVRRVATGERERCVVRARWRHADGHDVLVRLDVVVIRSPDGTPKGLAVEVRDAGSAVRERRRLAAGAAAA